MSVAKSGTLFGARRNPDCAALHPGYGPWRRDLAMTRLALLAALVLAAILPADAQGRDLKLFGQTFSLPIPASMIQLMSPTTEVTDTRVFTSTSREPHQDLIFVSLIRK